MQALRRERRRFARVGTIPIVAGDLVGGVRRVLEQIVLRVGRTIFNRRHFRVDGNHRVAETVEFVFGFAFGRFDHERAGDGPRERGRVEAIIHEAFRHVLGGGFVEGAQIQNTFVRHEAVAAVERREIFFQTRGDVIRVEDGGLRRLGQSVRAHHGDIHPRDRADARAAPRRGADGADGLFATEIDDVVAG